ncbi:MAG: OsmC family protein [Thermoprotei archaeon]
MSNDQSVSVRWARNFQFVGSDASGHSFVMDASKPNGEDTGLRPMDTLLLALGGCTGMDIVQGFKKFGKTLDSLDIKVSGKRAERPPRKFTDVTVHYIIRSKDADEQFVRKVIKDSEEIFCSVAATIRPGATIETTFELLNS